MHTETHLMSRTRWALLGGWMIATAGCASPIVGAECAEGILICEGVCTNTETSRDHCGACGVRCEVGDSCFDGICRSSIDTGLLAAGPPDATTDHAHPEPNDPPPPTLEVQRHNLIPRNVCSKSERRSIL